MRPALLAHGIDLRCVTVGRDEAALCEQSFIDEGCVLLAAHETGVKAQAQAFVGWCEENSVQLVMAVNSIAILSALPHAPEKIRVIARCATVFEHGYKITLSCYERLHRIVVLAPRQIDDLVRKYGADSKRITLIPNGTNPDRFATAAAKLRGTSPEILLAYLGRIHEEKGALFLPKILQRLDENNVLL